MEKRTLAFSNRWMFNRVLCEEEVFARVVRAALGIEPAEICRPESEKVYEPTLRSKGVRMDVVGRGDGRVYDIEIQVVSEPQLGKRMRYYQAALDTAELDRGDEFDQLPESYILFICCFDPYGKGLPVYSLERTCLEDIEVDVGDLSHWRVLSSKAWECADGELADVLRYVETGRADGSLSREIDGLVSVFNEDRKWVDRVITLEEDIARWGRREREEGREEGERRLGALISALLREKHVEDIERVSADAEYRAELFEEYGL